MEVYRVSNRYRIGIESISNRDVENVYGNVFMYVVSNRYRIDIESRWYDYRPLVSPIGIGTNGPLVSIIAGYSPDFRGFSILEV